jgi:hypothetical protein
LIVFEERHPGFVPVGGDDHLLAHCSLPCRVLTNAVYRRDGNAKASVRLLQGDSDDCRTTCPGVELS